MNQHGKRLIMRNVIQRGLALLWLVSLTACSDDTTDLNITGVDYAGQGIGSYYVVDPNNDKNRGGGESITPYSAGGIMCCYEVPREWHEGLNVEVVVRYPLEGDTTDERSESLAKREAEGKLNETIHVDIPEYDTPAKGTLWVQFLPNKKANVVVSNLSPDHKDFPGEVKGWPVPSDEYRRKLIDQKIGMAEGRLELSRENLLRLKKDPDGMAQEQWKMLKEIRSNRIDGFSGPDDPKFRTFLQEDLRGSVDLYKEEIEELKRARP